MRTLLLLVISAALLGACHPPSPAPTTEGQTSHYTLDTLWPALPDSLLLGDPTGLDLDGNSLWVFCRGQRQWSSMEQPISDTAIATNTVLELDRRTGKLLRSWGAGRFLMPHGLTVDGQGRIWLTDVWLHQVFCFTRTGESVMQLGEAGVPGDDSAHFNMPTDVAVARDGSFYVADGYGNSRVLKFDPTGHFLFAWGTHGSGEGQFNIPHAIDLDSAGNVFVADRENRRVQEFDADGKFLRLWTDSTMADLYAVSIDPMRNTPIAVDYLKRDNTIIGSDVWLVSPSTVLSHFGRSDNSADHPSRYHDLVMDEEGSIYVGDILNDRVQKWVRRK